MEKIEKKEDWYNNPNIITTALLGIVVAIIVLSQAFAVKNNLNAEEILRSLLNHNSIYLLVLVYFIFLKTKIGKRYFNFLNVLLIIVYFIVAVASVLTVVQSFGITSIVRLLLNLVLLFYLVYTFIKDTRTWKELGLNKAPFDEVSNNTYFYIIVILSIIGLVVNLIEAANFDEVFLSLLDSIYMIMFARYIYLYKDYSDKKSLKKVSKIKKDKEVKNG